MKNCKIVLLSIMFLFILAACGKYINVDYGNGIKGRYKKGTKDITSSFSPFERSADTTLIGYKQIYSFTDLKTGNYIFDTVPFCKEGKPYSEKVYEIYYYKGQPRFTKEIGFFTPDGFCRKTRYITDLERWKKQVELGLENLPPDFEADVPLFSNNFKIENSSNYKIDDISYVLKGQIKKKRYEYFNKEKSDFEYIERLDSLFTYLRKDEVRSLYANANIRDISNPELTSVLVWYSDFSCDLSRIKVTPNKDIDTFFRLIPDSLLNSKSCEFQFDTLAYKAAGIKVNPECYKTYISIKFKDGNYKTWTYYRCGMGERFNTLNNYPFMKKFIDSVANLNFAVSSNKELIDPDFTLGDHCYPNSIDITQ